MAQKYKILAYIPARSGSKRIKNKNIKNFLGKPLLAWAVEQALGLSFIDRVIVDTDSEKIAMVAKKFGADVPFLRPENLARDNSVVVDSILYFLDKLKRDEKYTPTHIMILQSTSPLRTEQEMKECWKLILGTNATTVVTVCPTHPKLYNLSPKKDLILINGSEARSNNMQAWPDSFILNGSVFLVEVAALRRERRVITNEIKAVICPKWLSVDIDTPEEWAMAELFYKNKNLIEKRIKKLTASN